MRVDLSMLDLKIVVNEIKGVCDIMKVGDYCLICGSQLSIPQGNHFCFWALQSILPLIPAKQRAINESNDWLAMTWEIECPDPKGQVILKIIPITSKS